MKENIYQFVTIVLSGSLFMHLSNLYNWNNRFWNMLFGEKGLQNKALKISIWIIASVIVQIIVEKIFKRFGLVEPILSIPVNISFGFCFAFIPLNRKE